MASVSSRLVTAIVLVLGSHTLGQTNRVATQQPPPNPFADIPAAPHYLNWWRPYRTVLNADVLRQINERVDAALSTGEPLVTLEHAIAEGQFGTERESTLLYPVLAARGEAGRRLLRQTLAEYQGGMELDDRWLVILAALGRMGEIESEKLLQNEFDRVLNDYTYSEHSVDIRLPVMDALLASMAARQTLTADTMESMTEREPVSPQAELVWMMGLEWAVALMPEERVLVILDGAFSRCRDEELQAALNLAPVQSKRVSVLQRFLLGPSSVWPLTRSFVLRDDARRSPVLTEYLGALYLNLLVIQADSTNGAYELDDTVIGRYVDHPTPPNRWLTMEAWILLTCDASDRSTPWQAFLTQHSMRIDDRDRNMASDLASRIHKPKSADMRRYYAGERPHADVSKPGVYLLGFQRAGGLAPTKSPGH